jgi:uncharacterized protein
VGDESFLLGNLETGIVNEGWQREFSRCNVYNIPECNGCWAKYFCSGGCAANAYNANGSLLKPDAVSCALQRKRVECGLFLAAK